MKVTQVAAEQFLLQAGYARYVFAPMVSSIMLGLALPLIHYLIAGVLLVALGVALIAICLMRFEVLIDAEAGRLTYRRRLLGFDWPRVFDMDQVDDLYLQRITLRDAPWHSLHLCLKNKQRLAVAFWPAKEDNEVCEEIARLNQVIEEGKWRLAARRPVDHTG